jgi:hypothetical protein
VVAAGEISVKEYDYLLTMQIMSLTEERVIELEKQMRDKRAEYELLQKMHIYQMWKNDLEGFLTELDKYEAQEEKDRLAHTAAGNGGKGKGKAGAKGRKPAIGAAKKAPVNNENKKPSNKAEGNSDQKKQTSMGDFMMKKEPKAKPKKKDDEDFEPESDS